MLQEIKYFLQNNKDMNLGIFSINDIIYFRANTVNKQGSAIDASSDPSFSVYAYNTTTPIITGTMTKVGLKTGFYEGNFVTTSYIIGQYFILIEAIVDGQTPNAHINFQLTSDETSIEETFQQIQIVGDSIPNIGTGTVSIDHNYGGTDKYRIVAHGKPLADVEIRAFVKSDYDAGRKANRYTVGQTSTLTNGRWTTVIRLDPGVYTLEFAKNGYKINSVNITVS